TRPRREASLGKRAPRLAGARTRRGWRRRRFAADAGDGAEVARQAEVRPVGLLPRHLRLLGGRVRRALEQLLGLEGEPPAGARQVGHLHPVELPRRRRVGLHFGTVTLTVQFSLRSFQILTGRITLPTSHRVCQKFTVQGRRQDSDLPAVKSSLNTSPV